MIESSLVKPQYTPAERVGINAVERTILRFGWIFREQSIADFGIDAHAEVCEGGKPTGGLIGSPRHGCSLLRGGER